MVQEYQNWEGGYEQEDNKAVNDQITYNGITANFAKSNPNLYEDAITRDFTVNALYFKLDDLSVVDPLGYGIKDIKLKLLNTCALNSIEEDPFRMLRAITIAATYDFDLSQNIIGDIKDTTKMRPLFDNKVSKDRVGDELNKMFLDKKGGIKALAMLTDLGILENYVTLMCTPDAE